MTKSWFAGTVEALARATAAILLAAPAWGGPPTASELVASQEDLLGHAALRLPDGPSYEYFAEAMPPLRYVNTAFRHYPIVLAAPRQECKARLVSNGSAINAAAGGNAWKDVGIPVHFRVGAENRPFGDDLTLLEGPHLLDGHLPIVDMTYRDGDSVYRQETFASTDPALAKSGVVFVRFTLTSGTTGSVSAFVDSKTPLRFVNRQLSTEQQCVAVLAGTGWEWDPISRSLTTRLSRDAQGLLAVFTAPAPARGVASALSQGMYRKQRQRCETEWRKLLGRGVDLHVPETIVNNAWRTVLGANFSIVSGNTVNYSAGNDYECEYITEGSRTVGAFLLFGFVREAKPMLLSLLDHSIPSHQYAVTGWKLRALAQYYWLTRDAAFFREHRASWEPLLPLILDHLDPQTGLTPKDFYASDIPQPVWNLKTNATCWRGLRDVAAVLREMGEPDPQLEARVQQYREAILDAVNKSVYRDFDPPFVPNTLLDPVEKPYESLTASRLGSYWCLVSNAVLDSGLFDVQPETNSWILDTLHRRGGVCMGMLRFDQHSGLFANDRGIDDNYTIGYTLYTLKHDDPGRALVSFYGKLAQGFTRDTFVGGEGIGLDPLDRFGRPMYLPPCTAGNAFFLWTLRHLLVQDWDTDDDGAPDTLRLMYAVPRRWLHEGQVIAFNDAPTAFGALSMHAESMPGNREWRVRLDLPRHTPRSTLLRACVPDGRKAVSASIGGTRLPVDSRGTVDLSNYRGRVTVRVQLDESDQ